MIQKLKSIRAITPLEIKKKIRLYYNKAYNIPAIVHIAINDICNLRCKHCDIWKNKVRDELTTEQWKSIIFEIKQWLGNYQLKFVGGEPFLREDLLDLAEFAREFGIFVGISTNGTLINEQTAKRICDIDLNEIIISLDSATPVLHNEIRNLGDTYRKVSEVINYIKKYNKNTSIIIATVISCKNLKEIPKLIKFVEDNKLNGIVFQPICNNFGREFREDWYLDNEFWPKNQDYEIDNVIDFMIEKRKTTFLVHNNVEQLEMFRRYLKNPNSIDTDECHSGKASFSVSPKGNMHLCFNKESIGNLIENNPIKLWKSNLANERRYEISICKRECKVLNCHYQK